MTTIPVPPPTQPAIDTETGMWTQPWYQYISQPEISATTPGTVLLTSGTTSSSTGINLVLSDYIAYRVIKIVLTKVIPVTDGVYPLLVTSTDAGVNYAVANYTWAMHSSFDDATVHYVYSSTKDALTTALLLGRETGNGASEGCDIEITLLDPFNAARKTKITWVSSILYSVSDTAWTFRGGGYHDATEDTTAVRFLFSSGNVSSGAYAVYGLN